MSSSPGGKSYLKYQLLRSATWTSQVIRWSTSQGMPETRLTYCICPLGMRIMVDCKGFDCHLCGKPITEQTYEHWNQA